MARTNYSTPPRQARALPFGKATEPVKVANRQERRALARLRKSGGRR